jgi:hypothetical protein
LTITNSCFPEVRYIRYVKHKCPEEYFFRLYDSTANFSQTKDLKFRGAYVQKLTSDFLYDSIALFSLQKKLKLSDDCLKKLLKNSSWYNICKFYPNGRVAILGSFEHDYPKNDSILNRKYSERRFYKLSEKEITWDYLLFNELWSIKNVIQYGYIQGDSIIFTHSSYFKGDKKKLTTDDNIWVYDSTLTADFPPTWRSTIPVKK